MKPYILFHWMNSLWFWRNTYETYEQRIPHAIIPPNPIPLMSPFRMYTNPPKVLYTKNYMQEKSYAQKQNISLLPCHSSYHYCLLSFYNHHTTPEWSNAILLRSTLTYVSLISSIGIFECLSCTKLATLFPIFWWFVITAIFFFMVYRGWGGVMHTFRAA